MKAKTGWYPVRRYITPEVDENQLKTKSKYKRSHVGNQNPEIENLSESSCFAFIENTGKGRFF